jgi:hypothetical protein
MFNYLILNDLIQYNKAHNPILNIGVKIRNNSKMDADATRLVFNILSTGFSTTVVENVVLEGQKKRRPKASPIHWFSIVRLV